MLGDDVLVLGAGFTGAEVARQASEHGARVRCHTRTEERAASLSARGFEVWRCETLEPDAVAALVRADTLVVIAFPPDGSTDARLAPVLRGAGSVRYVSSTGVYPRDVGHLDDETAVATSDAGPHVAVLAAERAYRAIGATVLRAPAIYGALRGLHVRVIEGKHRLAGDGSNVLSRIHVEDLAALLLARPEIRGETFVVSDGDRTPQVEVVRWICAEYGVPMPASARLDEAPRTLRGNRTLDPSRALRTLGVSPRWPSFRVGMART